MKECPVSCYFAFISETSVNPFLILKEQIHFTQIEAPVSCCISASNIYLFLTTINLCKVIQDCLYRPVTCLIYFWGNSVSSTYFWMTGSHKFLWRIQLSWPSTTKSWPLLWKCHVICTGNVTSFTSAFTGTLKMVLTVPENNSYNSFTHCCW